MTMKKDFERKVDEERGLKEKIYWKDRKRKDLDHDYTWVAWPASPIFMV